MAVQYDDIMRIFQRNGDDVLALNAKAAAEWIDCDFSDYYFVGSDVGESIVGCGVEEWWLFEALEDCLADNLHQLKIPDYFINQISHHSNYLRTRALTLYCFGLISKGMSTLSNYMADLYLFFDNFINDSIKYIAIMSFCLLQKDPNP